MRVRHGLGVVVATTLVLTGLMGSPTAHADPSATDETPVDTTHGAAAENPTAVIPDAEPVETTQHEVDLTGTAAETEESPESSRSTTADVPIEHPTDLPIPVDGQNVQFATAETPAEVTVAGVTWDDPDADVRVFLRSSAADWEEIEVVPDHGGDGPGGTEPIVMTDTDSVEVATVSSVPVQPRLMMVDPGNSGADAMAAPSSSGAPVIHSRADWGADESMRGSRPTYAKVQGVVVHHTAGGNGYTADQVPGIIRGIYSYHTNGLGWSDIGYNVLVDNFGRAWEGRAGGLTAAVQGAHAYGTNHLTFGISLMGNYDEVAPSAAAMDTIARVSGWKLAVHGADPNATLRSSTGINFPAISGHRDSYATACPGRYIYNQMGSLRTNINRYREAYLADRAEPTLTFGSRVQVGHGWPADGVVLDGGDINGDGHPDILLKRADGTLWFYGGQPNNAWSTPVQVGRGWNTMTWIDTGVDLNGDGIPDMLGRDSAGLMFRYTGRANGSFDTKVQVGHGWNTRTQIAVLPKGGGREATIVGVDPQGYLHNYDVQNGVVVKQTRLGRGWDGFRSTSGFADITGDGIADLMAVTPEGVLRVYPGTATGDFRPGGDVGSHWDTMRLPIIGTGLPGTKNHFWAVDPGGRLWKYPFTWA